MRLRIIFIFFILSFLFCGQVFAYDKAKCEIECPNYVAADCAGVGDDDPVPEEGAAMKADCEEGAKEKCVSVIPSCMSDQAEAQASGGGKYGLAETVQGTGLDNIKSIPEIVGKIIKAVLSLVATIFFVLMIYAGFLWMTSRGDSTQAGKAKTLIVNAIVGVAVVAGAWAITNFVISNIG